AGARGARRGSPGPGWRAPRLRGRDLDDAGGGARNRPKGEARGSLWAAALVGRTGRRRPLPLVPRHHALRGDRRCTPRHGEQGGEADGRMSRRHRRPLAQSADLELRRSRGMVERRRFGNLFAHLVLGLGVAIVAFPVYLCFIGSTHEQAVIANGQMPITPGRLFFATYYKAVVLGTSATTHEPVS